MAGSGSRSSARCVPGVSGSPDSGAMAARSDPVLPRRKSSAPRVLSAVVRAGGRLSADSGGSPELRPQRVRDVRISPVPVGGHPNAGDPTPDPAGRGVREVTDQTPRDFDLTEHRTAGVPGGRPPGAAQRHGPVPPLSTGPGARCSVGLPVQRFGRRSQSDAPSPSTRTGSWNATSTRGGPWTGGSPRTH